MTLAERYSEALLAAARLFEQRNELLAMLKMFHSPCGGRPREQAARCDACALIARIEGTSP